MRWIRDPQLNFREPMCVELVYIELVSAINRQHRKCKRANCNCSKIAHCSSVGHRLSCSLAGNRWFLKNVFDFVVKCMCMHFRPYLRLPSNA